MTATGIRVVVREHVLADRRVGRRVRVVVAVLADHHARIEMVLAEAGAATIREIRIRRGVVLFPAMATHAADGGEAVAAGGVANEHWEVGARLVARVTVAAQHRAAVEVVEVPPIHAIREGDVRVYIEQRYTGGWFYC